MYKSAVIDYYTNAISVARALGYTRSAISNWPEIIPEVASLKIQHLTKGKLKHDPDLYDKSRKSA